MGHHRGSARAVRLMSAEDDLLDLVIVGAGPAGIALGAEAVAAGISPARVLILERGEAHSFSIRKFYPESKLVTANYKGFPAVCTGVLCLTDASKGETLTYLDRAMQDNGLVVRYGEAVGAIRPREGFFLVETAAVTYRSKTCAVAIGILGRPQKPDWPIPSSLRARTRTTSRPHRSGRSTYSSWEAVTRHPSTRSTSFRKSAASFSRTAAPRSTG